MSTRCTVCGWLYPDTYPTERFSVNTVTYKRKISKRCRFCGGMLEKVYCRDCGEPLYLATSTKSHFASVRCKECSAKHLKKINAPRIARNESLFMEWVADLRMVDMTTLSEREWLNACRHFGGCALCGDEISVRAFFIARQFGGRYNAANIVPLCEKCGGKGAITKQPFKKFYGLSKNAPKEFLNIINYLKPIIYNNIKR